MIRSKLLRHTLFLLFLVGILNFFADYLYLYWVIWWFDMLVHFLAGATVAMATVLVLSFLYRTYEENSLIKNIILAVLGALVVGIIWELYELYFGITLLSDGIIYFRDTLSDILMDISGGFFGALYSHNLLRTKNNTLSI